MHDNYKRANAAPRCTRVRPNGLACTQPALRQHRFCRFHDPMRRLAIRFTVLEDAPSLHVACSEVVTALLANKIDKDTARLCFQGLRLVAANLPLFRAEMDLACRQIE